MNKKIVKIIVIILIVINLLLSTLLFTDNYFNYKVGNQWLKSSSPDGNYTIIANEKGHPFLCGKSSSYVMLLGNSADFSYDRLVYFVISIENDGKALDDNNCIIDWQNEYVKFSTVDYDGKIVETYRFYYNDYL